MQKTHNHGDKLHDTGFGKDFLDMTPKPQATITTKRNKLDYVEMDNFHALYCSIKVKMQPTEWKKVFLCYIFDKGLISRLYEVCTGGIQPCNRKNRDIY